METYPVTCWKCGTEHEIKAKEDDINRWQGGELIQEALPYLKPFERELLISGTCEPCFEKIFASFGSHESAYECGEDENPYDDM